MATDGTGNKLFALAMALRISEQGRVVTILSDNLELVERFNETRTKHTLRGKQKIQFSNRVLHKLQKILEKVTRKVKWSD